MNTITFRRRGLVEEIHQATFSPSDVKGIAEYARSTNSVIVCADCLKPPASCDCGDLSPPSPPKSASNTPESAALLSSQEGPVLLAVVRRESTGREIIVSGPRVPRASSGSVVSSVRQADESDTRAFPNPAYCESQPLTRDTPND